MTDATSTKNSPPSLLSKRLCWYQEQNPNLPIAEDKLAISHQIRRKSMTSSSDGVIALRQLANCDTTADPSTRIARAAASIATEMKKLHGGTWETKIDHQRRLVMVWAIDQ